MSEIRLSNSVRSISPTFIDQRKIAYVENPYDGQASSCIQNCNLKYMQSCSTTKRCQTSEKASDSAASKDRDVEENEGEEIWALTTRSEDFCENDWSCLFSPLQCHNNSPSGEIQLSLSYDPFLGTLKVAIIKARGLTCPLCAKKPRNSGIICVGTFVRVSLFSNNNQLATKNTAMKTRKAEIFFYDRFSFRVRNDVVGQCRLQCRAVHKVGSILKRDHVIGQVLIGGEDSCDDDSVRHWQEMLEKPRKNLTHWYYLKEE